MKKIMLIFVALSLSILFLACGNKNENYRYSSISDRDTIESFGEDGQFGIFRLFSHEGEKCLDLYDVKNDKSIDLVSNYKESAPLVYTIGEKGYTKINYADKSVIQSDNLENFSDADKKNFNELKH